MEPDNLDPGSDNMSTYQKKIFWKQIKSPRFRATNGMAVIFGTWTQRATKNSSIKWPIVHLIIPDFEAIESAIKSISSPGLIQALEHDDVNIEFGGARCTTTNRTNTIPTSTTEQAPTTTNTTANTTANTTTDFH